MINFDSEKRQVHDFWNEAACGEDLYLENCDRKGFQKQAAVRYRLEPMIVEFADFHASRGKMVLEIGVGLGADHERFASAGAHLYGIDLTRRAVYYTQKRLEQRGLSSELSVGDAESLEFPTEKFDMVYSWGVLHRSPNIWKATEEVYRVLKPGGVAKVMIYHKWSLIGFMLWCRYALFLGRPWRSLEYIYGRYLESPGTKAFSRFEASRLFSDFEEVTISTPLGHGDLLESDVGQRHRGLFLNFARLIWPRWLFRRAMPKAGLGMMIEARK